MITLVGQNTAAATSVTIPSDEAGDLIIMFAFNNASTTVPTLPAGWTSLAAPAGANTCAMLVGYKVAAGSDTSGTWTTATGLVCLVYRGTIVAPGTATTGSGTGTAITYPATTLAVAGKSWIIGFAGHRTATNVNSVAPSGLTIEANGVTTIVGLDTAKPAQANYAATAVTVNASSGWFATTLEVKPATTAINNYQQVSVGNGMSAGEKIR